MTTRRLALGLSGGGDSTALLLALRAALPEVALHALIIDHGLRPESASEAQVAAASARAAGAEAQIIRWSQPRTGQARARTARHALLAAAAREAGATLLCLGHTLDDRIETLRMRAVRPGDETRMTGLSDLDPSPAWPQGEGLTIARPFLGLRRRELRAYLNAMGAVWIDDPSNDDPGYERIRLRQSPITPSEEDPLLQRSEDARAARARLHERARGLLAEASALTPWGGAELDRAAFEAADRDVALKALETLVLAASGAAAPPEPGKLEVLLCALEAGRAASAGGAHLTAGSVLGRDAGAAGRADGCEGAAVLILNTGETGAFDGRWRFGVERPVQVQPLGGREAGPAREVPPPLRPGLAAIHDRADGSRLGVAGLDAVEGVTVESLASARIDARLLPCRAPTWFDGVKIAAQVRAALAKPVLRPNMKRDDAGPAPVQAAQDVKLRQGK